MSNHRVPSAFLRVTASILLLLTFAAPRADAGPGAWTRTGPLEGAPVTALAIDPNHPATVYLGTSSNVVESGVYKSVDGGETWTRVGPAELRQVDGLAVHPRRGATVYAVSGGTIHRTRDAGVTWERLRLSPSPFSRGAIELAIDPSRPSRLIAVHAIPCTVHCDEHYSLVYESVNGGNSWKYLSWLPLYLVSLEIDPRDPDVLYAGGDGDNFNSRGVVKSVDGGRTWQGVGGRNVRGAYVVDVAVDPVRPEIVYAITFGNLLKSVDGGESWREVGRGLGDAVVTELAFRRPNPAVLYAASWDGLFVTANGGETWRPSGGGLGRRRVEALAVDPRTPAVLYAGTAGDGVLKSVDGGVTWRQKRRGLDLVTVATLAVAPASPNVLYAGAEVHRSSSGESSGIYRSVDGGSTWRPVNRGLPARRWGFQTLAVDPSDPGTVYAATLYQGLYKSVDGGDSWSAVNDGLIGGDEAIVLDLAIDPQASSTVYAGTYAGVYKSTDGAGSWSDAGAGFPDQPYAFAVTVDPRRPATVYASANHRVYRSDDGAVTWAATGYVSEVGVADLAVDRRSGVVYAATVGAGAFKSADGGQFWRRVRLPRTARVLRLEILAGNPDVLYAAVDGKGVFRSADGGESWTALAAGLPRTTLSAMAVVADGPVKVFTGFREVAGVYEWEE